MSPSKEQLGVEELAAATATRLCAVQARLADADAEMREAHLAEEVERALMQVRADEQPEFLALLASRFPSWDSDLRAPSGAERTQSTSDRKELSDPAFLATRLVEVCKDLSEEKKERVKAALAKGGLLGGGSTDWPADDLAKLRQVAFGGEALPIEAGRALQLLRMLLEFANQVDKLTWQTSQEMSGKPAGRPKQPLSKVASRFLSSHEQAPSGIVQQEVEELRKLTAAFILACGRAGSIAYQKVEKLRPSVIEDLVRSEGRSLMKGKPAACWEKYTQLAEQTLDPARFDVDLRREIARQVEVTIGGRS